MTGKPAWTPSGNEKRYKITKPGAKYVRVEDRRGRPEAIVYSGLDARNPHLQSTVLLSPQAAHNLAFLKLVEVADRDRVVVKDASLEQKISEGIADGAADVDVPDDWASLPALSRKLLATQITGKEYGRVKEADAVIEDYVHAVSQRS